MELILSNIGLYFLTLTAFFYLFFIILSLRMKTQFKELTILLIVVGILIVDLFLRNIFRSDENINIYFLILSCLFYGFAMFGFRDKEQKYRLSEHKDVVVFFFIALAIIGINSVSSVAFEEIPFFAMVKKASDLALHISAMMFFLYGATKYFKDYPKRIKNRDKLSLFAHLMIFLIIIFNYTFYFDFIIKQELLDFDRVILKYLEMFSVNLTYIFIAFYSITNLIFFQKEIMDQYIDYTQHKKGEFKILNMIENLVIKGEELDATLKNILSIASYLTKSDGSIIYLYDKEKKNFYAKELLGYSLPLFIINDKLLENQDKVDKKLRNTDIGADSEIFRTIIESDEVCVVNREPGDVSRLMLKSLNNYMNNIHSMLACKIEVDGELFGVIILQKFFYNFIESDISIFKAISSFSGVLIGNIRSKVMEKEKERLENEMKLAERIQTGILPKNYSIPGYQVAAFMQPATEVGGDYYDIITTDDGSSWVTIGDVTGHGVSAGIIMMMLQTSASSIINDNPAIKPDRLISVCNRIMFDNIQNRLLLDQFITSCFLKFNKEGEFEYAGAHEEIIVYRALTGHVERIKTHGIWLGLLEDISAQTTLDTFTLQSGDIALVYTDGVIEIKDRYSEQYDMQRLMTFLELNGKKDPEVISSLLMTEINNFKHVQDDDITFVIIKKE